MNMKFLAVVTPPIDIYQIVSYVLFVLFVLYCSLDLCAAYNDYFDALKKNSLPSATPIKWVADAASCRPSYLKS